MRPLHKAPVGFPVVSLVSKLDKTLLSVLLLRWARVVYLWLLWDAALTGIARMPGGIPQQHMQLLAAELAGFDERDRAGVV